MMPASSTNSNLQSRNGKYRQVFIHARSNSITGYGITPPVESFDLSVAGDQDIVLLLLTQATGVCCWPICMAYKKRGEGPKKATRGGVNGSR